jgi:hypothetical protein
VPRPGLALRASLHLNIVANLGVESLTLINRAGFSL